MLARAAAKGVYDDLAAGDAVAVLRARPQRYDLALAADVLCYLGDLAPVFAAVAGSLAADGLFAFTVEALDDGGDAPWRLRPSLRYAHDAAAVEAEAVAAGFGVVAFARQTLRLAGGAPVGSFAVMLRRGI
jgi:predicted TPR repeat methyltransferase